MIFFFPPLALSHHVWFGLFLAPQATNEVVGRVPKATQEEMLAAVDSCSRAFYSWSETSILSRQQIFLRYQQLIKDNIVRKSALALIFPLCFQFEYWSQEIQFWDVRQLFFFLPCWYFELIVLFFSYFRKSWPKWSHWSRARLLRTPRGMFSGDFVSNGY